MLQDNEKYYLTKRLEGEGKKVAQGMLMIAAERLMKAAELYFESGEDAKVFQSRDLADCVRNHAAAAGVAAAAMGVVPVAGTVAALAVLVGANWRMYIKICEIIGLKMGRDTLKAIASAVITNIAANIASVFAFSVLTSVVPGVGAVATGVMQFCTLYFAGLMFLNILTRLFRVRRKDIEDMSNEEWIASIKKEIAGIDKKALIKEAKNVFMEMKSNGSMEQAAKTVDISDEDA